MERNQNSHRPRQPFIHGKKMPMSSFIYGVVLLITCIFGIQVVQNIASMIAPKTFSEEILAFSSNEHIQYYCSNYSTSESYPVWNEFCLEKDGAKQDALREKYAPVVKDFVQQEVKSELIENILFLLGLLVFIKIYRKK
ncbi:MAG: hypothetical protein JXR30_01060 [Alphaproteobacteria bacterium]|nr:hypothetical protein [Alphaproteobacteria bacterium]